MDRTEIFGAVTQLTVDVLGVEPEAVVEEARFKEDLDADSLDLVELVMALEEKFDISVPEDELEGVETIGQAVSLVSDKLGART
jgi:acyl carrier protein